MNRLFIGGVADGELIAIDSGKRFISLPATRGSNSRDHYVLTGFRWEDREAHTYKIFFVMVCDGWREWQVIERLESLLKDSRVREETFDAVPSMPILVPTSIA